MSEEKLLHERLTVIEEWCEQHTIEGLEYGDDFEERDKNLTSRIEHIEYRLDKFNTENHKFYQILREGIQRQEDQIECLIKKAEGYERWLLYVMFAIPIIIVLSLFR